jgi:hypothetical protein
MLNAIFTNTTVATLVNLTVDPVTRKVSVGRKVSVTKGDIGKAFPMKDGKPVFGPMVARELTYAEMVSKGIAPDIKAAKKLRASNYLASVALLASENPLALAA